MPIVYNLTDVPNIQRRTGPKEFRIGTARVRPGESVEVSDTFNVRQVAGLVQEGSISIGHLPVWYQEAKNAHLAAPPKKEETARTDERGDEKTSKRRRKE
jgi:hypothetical protein